MSGAPPRGWGVVAGLSAALCVLFGVTMNSFGVLLLPIGESFGSTSEEASRGVMAFVLAMNLAMPAAGWLLDRVPPRAVMLVGAALTALGCGLAAQSPSLGALVVALALAGVGIGASTYVPAVVVAVLSGPSFAAEIAKKLPAAVTLATAEEAQGRALSHALSHPPFRCYWSDDVVGAEIGGAVKNVYAIAAGIVAGKKLGSSAHAALVTRGFAEMARFGTTLGARRETLTGLSGLGDLVLTCGSPQSRNMSLGIELGKGRSVKEVLDKRLTVTEGVYTASAVVELAAARGIEMPIAHAVHAVVSGLATVDEAIEALLARPLRAEV